MKKVICFFLLPVAMALSMVSAKVDKPGVNWISLDELASVYSNNPKPILFDVYTDWCGWCKEMDRITYHHKKLVPYLNENYYAVKFDAESKEVLRFNGKDYAYDENMRMNTLAIYMLNGRMEFPTTVFLPDMYATPAALPGFMKAKEMEAPLRFFAEGNFRTQTFVEFNKTFKGNW
jgi:thioredoxin-related protein